MCIYLFLSKVFSKKMVPVFHIFLSQTDISSSDIMKSSYLVSPPYVLIVNSFQLRALCSCNLLFSQNVSIWVNILFSENILNLLVAFYELLTVPCLAVKHFVSQSDKAFI